MAYPPEYVQELLCRTDIERLIGLYTKLKLRGDLGKRESIGLCPFHREKSPSFTVTNVKGFYHCFGCGAHGNAIHFLQEWLGRDFVDAVKALAKHNRFYYKQWKKQQKGKTPGE